MKAATSCVPDWSPYGRRCTDGELRFDRKGRTAEWLESGCHRARLESWTVNPDSSAPSAPNVLTQNAKGTFPWAVKEGVSITDGFVEVKFKAISGKEDQAGGVMWRWKDGNNYYVARANALENNVSLYYTANGRRNTIKYVKAPVPLNTWHTLRVDFAGNAIKVSLNGKTYIEEKDTHITGTGPWACGRRRTASPRLTIFHTAQRSPSEPVRKEGLPCLKRNPCL